MTNAEVSLGATARAGRQRYIALIAVLAAAYIGVVDAFIVAVATPAIQADLGASRLQLELVFLAYILPYASALVLGGRLGDRIGYRGVFGFGLSAFAVSSLLCALARNPDSLIAARLFQGLAAALMLPQVLASIRILFTDDQERAWAVGCYGAVLGFGAMTGQLVGGFLVGVDGGPAGWRHIFWVNIPVAVAALVLSIRTIPNRTLSVPVTIDWVGAILQCLAASLILGGMLSFIYQDLGTAAVLMLIGGGAALLALFVLYEKRIAAANRTPLIPPALFRVAEFRIGAAAIFVYYLSAAMQVILTYYLQSGMGLSPQAAGLIFVPFGVGFIITSLNSQRIVARHGRRAVVGALTAGVCGLAALPVIAGLTPPQVASWALGCDLLFVGLAQGAVAAPMLASVLRYVPPEMAGAGAGVLLTVIQMANAVGLAILVGIFFHYAAESTAADHLLVALVIAIASYLPFGFAAIVLIRRLMLRLPDYRVTQSRR